MNKKILMVILSVIIIVSLLWFVISWKTPTLPNKNPTNTPETITTPTDQTLDWLTFSDNEYGFSFKYPQNFGATVWKPTNWPPKVTIAASGVDPVVAGCPNTEKQTGVTQNALTFTLYKGSDAGAGQLYSEYCYIIESGKDYSAVVDFVIQSHTACGFGGCGAYCGTEYENECTNLNRQNDIELPIQKIIDTVTFNPISSPTTDNQTITLDNDNSTLDIMVGQGFLVKLGEDYNWSVNIGDQSIISRKLNISVIRGAQGVYLAHKQGLTDLLATGDPVCRNSTPPCAAPSKSFTLHINVK